MSRYAISDLHGQLDLFNQVKGFINDKDIVYALGDFGDRGPEPWRTLQAVLDDSQFIYLMGNHDYMLIKAIEEYKRKVEADGYCDLKRQMYSPKGSIPLLSANGGMKTLEQWLELDESKREKYYWQLKNLPLEIRLAALDNEHFIYLTHAGLTPGVLEGENIEDFVWDRQHFYDKWDSKGHLSIGGHTPYEVMIKYLDFHSHSSVSKKTYPYSISNGYCVYSGGSKINIDCGAHDTNKTVLLNIDTLEGHIFTTKGESNEKNNA